MSQTIQLTIEVLERAMTWFAKEHPQYLELELAKRTLIKELNHENQTTQRPAS